MFKFVGFKFLLLCVCFEQFRMLMAIKSQDASEQEICLSLRNIHSPRPPKSQDEVKIWVLVDFQVLLVPGVHQKWQGGALVNPVK